MKNMTLQELECKAINNVWLKTTKEVVVVHFRVKIKWGKRLLLCVLIPNACSGKTLTSAVKYTSPRQDGRYVVN